jgi:hypothetical protein
LQQIVRHRLFFWGCPVPESRNQAERYRDVAEEYRRLANSASTEMRDRYLRMAEHYRKLAEAEERSTQACRNGD